jgi:hypothetical protein
MVKRKPKKNMNFSIPFILPFDQWKMKLKLKWEGKGSYFERY